MQYLAATMDHNTYVIGIFSGKTRGAGNVSRQGDGNVLIIFAVVAEIIQVYAR